MTTEWTTESIVREVLRRLTQLGDSSPTVDSAPSTLASQLSLSDRVVSLSLVDGKLDGVQQVIVGTSAVITPAVRDELKRRNIDVQRREVTTDKVSAKLALLLLTDDPRICLKTWKKNVNACETYHARNAAELAARAAQWVDETHVAVAWSQRPIALACRMNKLAIIRAFAADDERLVQRGVEEAGANLLVLSTSSEQLKWQRCIEQFRRGSKRGQPDESR